MGQEKRSDQKVRAQAGKKDSRLEGFVFGTGELACSVVARFS